MKAAMVFFFKSAISWPWSNVVPVPEHFPRNISLAGCQPVTETQNLWTDIVAGKAVMIGFWWGN